MINAQYILGQSKGQVWLPEEFFQTSNISPRLWAGARLSKVRPCYCQYGNCRFMECLQLTCPPQAWRPGAPKPHTQKPMSLPKNTLLSIPAQLRHLPHIQKKLNEALQEVGGSEYATITYPDCSCCNSIVNVPVSQRVPCISNHSQS